MPLNYSKWDALELSDDSDIEGHPNIDHASLVRWKQRDIHEKREERKFKIKQYEQELINNDVLYPKIVSITEQIESAADGPAEFNSIVARLKNNPDPHKPAPDAPLRYDDMLLDLMMSILDECKKEGVLQKDDKISIGNVLVKKLKGHQDQLLGRQAQVRKELAQEKAEQTKRITSDDIHEGFSSSYVKAAPEPKPIVSSLSKDKDKDKGKGKKSTTVIETLNAPSASAQPKAEAPPPESDEETDAEEDLPELTPELLGFSKIRIGRFEESYEYIKKHRSVYVPGADDSLLVAAFNAEMKGDSKYAKQCVHQSCLIQFCQKLGPDGPALFFKRAIDGNKKALDVFHDDVESTYKLLKTRVAANKEEAAQGRETVQLVAQDPSITISFDVPEGPPPEHLELSEELQHLDVEEVRKALQMRWDIFMGFKPKLRKALKSGKLDEVNEVLGKMEVSEAENVVELLNTAGILSFADDGKIRDMTGKEEGEQA